MNKAGRQRIRQNPQDLQSFSVAGTLFQKLDRVADLRQRQRWRHLVAFQDHAQTVEVGPEGCFQHLGMHAGHRRGQLAEIVKNLRQHPLILDCRCAGFGRRFCVLGSGLQHGRNVTVRNGGTGRSLPRSDRNRIRLDGFSSGPAGYADGNGDTCGDQQNSQADNHGSLSLQSRTTDFQYTQTRPADHRYSRSAHPFLSSGLCSGIDRHDKLANEGPGV